MAALEHFAAPPGGDLVTSPIGRVECCVAGSSEGEQKGRPVPGSWFVALDPVVVSRGTVREDAGSGARDGSPP